jgi:DNA ligase 1
MQSTSYEAKAKQSTTPEEQAHKEALAMVKKKEKQRYFKTSEDAMSADFLIPMKALSYGKRKQSVLFPCDLQRKFDGVRCTAAKSEGKIVLRSYTGEELNLTHIMDGLKNLPEGYVLDGELYCHGLSLQKIISLVKRYREESKVLSFYAFDLINLLDMNEPWMARRSNLEELFSSIQVELVKTSTARSHEDITTFHDRVVQDGYEGAIIRHRGGKYRFNYRSPDILKVKEFDDAEFKILKIESGKGKCKGEPRFTCQCEGGTFNCAIKGSAEERKALFKDREKLIGQALKVRFFGFSDEQVPKLPVGICIRPKGI